MFLVCSNVSELLAVRIDYFSCCCKTMPVPIPNPNTKTVTAIINNGICIKPLFFIDYFLTKFRIEILFDNTSSYPND